MPISDDADRWLASMFTTTQRSQQHNIKLEKNHMRNAIKRLIAPALLLAVVATTGYAQRDDVPVGRSVIAVPVGTITICPVKWRTILTGPAFGTVSFEATASGTFESTGASGPGEVASSTQNLNSLTSSGVAGEFGEITWTVVSSGETTIEANQAAADFPATANIRFTPSATVGGRTYKASGEVTLSATVNSFPPTNETFTSGPVSFLNDDGTEAFSIELQNFVVGGPAAGDPEDNDHLN